jgi:hypothetical protein
MVRPERFELPTLWFVARCSIQLSYGRNPVRSGTIAAKVLIIAEILWLIKCRTVADISAYRNYCTRQSGRVYFYDFNKLLASFLHVGSVNVNLSRRRQFLLTPAPSPGLRFQVVGNGRPGATNNCRRSGAQRGALEDKLRPEVFLDAPCIFPSFGFIWPTADLPQSSPLADELSG